MRKNTKMVDVCVVGGGISGICAALAAGRHNVSVALIHDRPVLGGASSSENRMHICGADRHGKMPDMRETGILEELRLENLWRNPQRNFSVWDTILYEKVKFEKNITLLLNTTCLSAEMDGGRIKAVTGWQLTTQTYHMVEANIFVDCSGDGILAPLTGAQFRTGREGKNEYGESLAPEKADKKTMGLTCLFKAVDTGKPQPFKSFPWAYKYPAENNFPFGKEGHRHLDMGYWWIETGGEDDTIHDAEEIRDELLKMVYGVWDHIKNYCIYRGKARNWALEWVQFLPTKRESVRYTGGYVLTQNDILSGGRFEDVVTYGGWPIDDHDPGGFKSIGFKKRANVVVDTPSPYGIPYRIFYSCNVDNLMFAGRCISCSHIAFSSTRVMGTCAAGGQAVGTAAAIAVKAQITPGEVGSKKIDELQQNLLADDCFLPGLKQKFSFLTFGAKLTASSGNPEPVRDGISRPVGKETHRWSCGKNDFLEYRFNEESYLEKVTVVFDSGLSKLVAMSWLQKDNQLTAPPSELVRRFHIDIRDGKNWKTIFRCRDNHQRFFTLTLGKLTRGIRLTIDETWGSKKTGVYSFFVS
ncbi:MAG: FAD-dependent oxidoreductase [Candidatus Omnitrophota bacterium]